MDYQLIGTAITGSGSAFPNQVLDNQGLSQIVDTSDEWISSRTGIQQRRIANQDESLADIAAQAAQAAIAMAHLDPEEIDLILLATSTPDDLFGKPA